MTETTQQKVPENKAVSEKPAEKKQEKAPTPKKADNKKKSAFGWMTSVIAFLFVCLVVVFSVPQTRQASERLYREKVLPVVQKAMFWKKTPAVVEEFLSENILEQTDAAPVHEETDIDIPAEESDVSDDMGDVIRDDTVMPPEEKAQDVSADIAALTAQVNILTERLAVLEARENETTEKVYSLEREKADNTAFLALKSRFYKTEAKIQESASEKIKTAAMLMTLFQLRQAASSGKSFLTEEQAFAHFVDPKSVLAQKMIPLKAYAETGVMTLAALQESFPEYARRLVIQSDSAGAEGWFQKAMAGLRSLVVVRRLDAPVEDTSTKAILARAEIAVENGQLQTAVMTLKNLNNNDVTVVMPWISAAERMLLVDNALNEMTALLMSQKFAR